MNLQRVLRADTALNAAIALALAVSAPWLSGLLGFGSPVGFWALSGVAALGATLHWTVTTHPRRTFIRALTALDVLVALVALIVAAVGVSALPAVARWALLGIAALAIIMGGLKAIGLSTAIERGPQARHLQ